MKKKVCVDYLLFPPKLKYNKFLDKKRSEHVIDVEEEIDFVQPTPPRPTPRENRKKEKQTTTSTFIDNDGFVCKHFLFF